MDAEFDTILSDCKEILIRVLNTEDGRFAVSDLCQRLVHKCAVFSAPLHTIASSEDNVTLLCVLRGCLLDVQEFISKYGETPLDGESVTLLDTEFSNISIRLTHVAYKLLKDSPEGDSISEYDLLHKDCVELVNLIFMADPSGFINLEDCYKVVESCRILEGLLHKVREDKHAVQVLRSLQTVLGDAVDFLYVTTSSTASSALAKALYYTSRSAYNRSVHKLLLRIAHATHQVEHLVPVCYRDEGPLTTVGFAMLLAECHALISGIQHSVDTHFVNPEDCRHLMHSCRSLNEPLRKLMDTDISLTCLEELETTLTAAKSFLETYACSSVYGETVYFANRSTYDKAWEDIMLRIGHDTHVLLRCCSVQDFSAEFRANLKSCKTGLTDIVAFDKAREIKPEDCERIKGECLPILELLNNLHETEANHGRLQELQTVITETKEFLDEFEANSSLGQTVCESNPREYTRELEVILAKLDHAHAKLKFTANERGSFSSLGSLKF